MFLFLMAVVPANANGFNQPTFGSELVKPAGVITDIVPSFTCPVGSSTCALGNSCNCDGSDNFDGTLIDCVCCPIATCGGVCTSPSCKSACAASAGGGTGCGGVHGCCNPLTCPLLGCSAFGAGCIGSCPGSDCVNNTIFQNCGQCGNPCSVCCAAVTPCPPSLETQPCCSGPNAALPCALGGDFVGTTESEKCHSGVCVGCIKPSVLAVTPASALCNVAAGETIAFLVDADNSASLIGICANATRVSFDDANEYVRIVGWRIVHGPVPVGSHVTKAHLDKFVGVFSFKAIEGSRVELACVPTPELACNVSNIVFGIGGSLCFAEFDVGERKKREVSPFDDNRAIGGSLLNPNPFGT